MSYKGRHRKPTDNTEIMKKIALGTSIGLGATVVPATFAGTASAASDEAWERIAACESGDMNVPNSGRWNLPYGHADSTGGLQIQLRTWNDFGGQQYAPAPYLATKAQQIAIAEKILARQGSRAWVCNSPGHGIASGALTGAVGNPDATATPTVPVTPSVPAQRSVSDDAAREVLDLVNAERAKAGVGPLTLDASLNDFAYAWSRTMAHEDRMYHSDLGFPGSYRGENVAVGQGSAARVVADWMASEGHRKNILSANYSKMGVGLHDDGKPYWAQVFAGPGGAPSTPPVSDPVDAEDGVYKVKKGDYLAKIASALKLSGGWQRLYEINKKIIGSDPNLVRPGQELRLPGHEAPVAPYADGKLPTAGKSSPSAKPLQEELKRVGYLADSVELADVYGPKTRAAVAHFHVEHPEYAQGSNDVQIGPKGWKHLVEMSDNGAGAAPSTPAPSTPSPAPKPDPVEPPQAQGKVYPVSGITTTNNPYGAPRASYTLGYHTGVDFSAPSGTPVRAAASGTVLATGWSSSYGNNVQIKHSDGTYTFYAHLLSKSASAGQTVSAGEVIGLVGSTGNSSGPHLHFEVRTSPNFGAGNFINPMNWLAS